MALDTLGKAEVGTIESKTKLFVFDGVISETHNIESTITKFPIEDGARIADSIIDEPIVLELDGVVADMPISLFGPGTFEGGESRSMTAFEELLSLRDDHEIVSVQTGLILYDSMLISKISPVRDAQTNSVLSVRMTFEQAVITTSSKRGPDSLSGDEAQQQGGSKVNGGKKQLTPAPASTQSLGQKFLGALGIKL